MIGDDMDMRAPMKFSIVTPSLNQGQFIEETIRSVLTQEGDFFIEYIVADGGSTDNSVEIIKKYAALVQEKKVGTGCRGITLRWWSKKDEGQVYALREGFSKTEGNILGWINSDDMYMPGAFEVIMMTVQGNPESDLIHGDMIIENMVEKKTQLIRSQQINYRILSEDNVIQQPSTFFTRSSYNRVGGLDTSFRYVFDYDLWLKIARKRKMLYISQTLSTFRIWAGSSTVSQATEHKREKIILMRKYNLKMIDQGVVSSLAASRFVQVIKKQAPGLYYWLKHMIDRINTKSSLD
jgi:glycosyltransferase involved in cell wall biosynthesis